MNVAVKQLSELPKEKVSGHQGFESYSLAEVSGKNVTVRMLVVAPGGVGPVPAHQHPDVHFFHVIEGTLSLTIEKETHKISKGECIEVPAGCIHQLQNNGSEKTRVLAVKWG